MKKFKEYIKEDACATLGNTGGMGAVISAQPSATPGSVNASDSIAGSGDIGQLFGTYAKPALKTKKKKGKHKMSNLTTYANFRP
jgi:hypothetical protein